MPRTRAISYTVILEEDPPGHWHAYAPAVPGCFAGGRTRSDALRRYRSALKLHLQTLTARGENPPVERRPLVVQVTL